MTTYQYTTLVDPASFYGNLPESALGVNDLGAIVGFDGVYPGGGYILSNGTWTYLDYSGAEYSTVPFGINDLGQVVGSYGGYDQHSHGFLYSGGVYTSLDDPLGVSTYLYGINDSGEIVGTYYDASNAPHAFIYLNGNYTSLLVPNSVNSIAAGINDSAEVVGSFSDGTAEHGFLYDNGTYTTLDVPGSTGTEATGINNLGQVVGTFQSGTNTEGFVYSNGSYTILAGTSSYPTVEPSGINNSGEIVGQYFNSGGGQAFIATPVSSPPLIDAANSVISGDVTKIPNATTSIVLDYANGGSSTTPSGSIVFTDQDASAQPTASIDTAGESVSYQGSSGQTYTLTSAQIATIDGGFQIAAEAGNTNNGTIDWTYSIPNGALAFLGVGETLTLTVPVIIGDPNDGSVTQDVTVTINGANDSPNPTPLTESVMVGGTLKEVAPDGVLASHPDPNIHDTLAVTEVSFAGVTLGPLRGGANSASVSSGAPGVVHGEFGTLTLDADGSFSYVNTMSPTIEDLLSALSGGVLKDTFSYTVSDGNGGTATSTLTIDITAPPSTAEFFNASEMVYQDNAPGAQAAPSALTGLTVIATSPASELSDGFFAQAFKDASGNVVIAFEGTEIGNSLFDHGSLRADIAIFLGLEPKAFTDAYKFVIAIEQQVGSESIYLTGHSLGGAEAEDVSFLTGLPGKAFAAPGIPLLPAAVAASNFTDYVDYGDPIGKFGNHYGSVDFVGSKNDSSVLTDAAIKQLASLGTDPAATSIVGIYHSLEHYGHDLGLHLLAYAGSVYAVG